jgi:hypothetical protein
VNYDEEPETAEPFFEDESPERDVALVALEAARLSRSIFSSEVEQAVLALALAHPRARYSDGLTPRALGSLLALDNEAALDLMAELVALGLASLDEWALEVEEEPALDTPYALTEQGKARATDVATVAARHLPGWPPRR